MRNEKNGSGLAKELLCGLEQIEILRILLFGDVMHNVSADGQLGCCRQEHN